jgi:type III secretion protein O
LLRIKLFREEQAERELEKARARLRDATEALKTAKKALKDFQRESLQREKEMYTDLCSRLVVLREIDDVRADVDLMKEKTEQLGEEAENAEHRQQEAIEETERARLIHWDAVRNREKFSELLKTVEAERELELARFEELEMEESSEGRFAFRNRSDDNEKITEEADE